MSLEEYFQVLEAVEAARLFTNDGTNLTWVREWDASLGQFGDSMSTSGCYLGGMFALTSKIVKSRDFKNITTSSIRHPDRLMKLAVEITETCTLATNKTSTGVLGSSTGETFFPMKNYQNIEGENNGNQFTVLPDLVESYFILWKTTGDEKYRELAWGQVQRIQSLLNKRVISQTSVSPIFLSATLKYLYLTFAETDLFPLEKWIFNAVGHPLPICGQNKQFFKC